VSETPATIKLDFRRRANLAEIELQGWSERNVCRRGESSRRQAIMQRQVFTTSRMRGVALSRDRLRLTE